MTLPKIEFVVTAKDVDAFKKQLQSISQATVETNLKILQSREQLALQEKQLLEGEANAEQSAQTRIRRLREQQSLNEKQELQRDMLTRANAREQEFRQVEGLMRRYSALRVGSLIGGLTGSSTGRQMGSLGGLFGGFPGAVAGGLTGMVTGILHNVASSIAQVGGYQGFGGMLQEAADSEKAFQVARMKVAPNERMSLFQMQEMSRNMSENPEFGAPKLTEVAKVWDVLGTKGALQRNMDQGSLQTIMKVAHIGGVDPSQIAESWAQARNITGTNQGASQMIMSAMGIGRETTFGPEAFEASRKAIAATAMLGGDRVSNIRTVMGVEGAFGRIGFEPQRAGTAVERLLTTFAKNPALGNAFGATRDQAGNITNFDQVLSKWATTSPEKLASMKALGSGPLVELHTALEEVAKRSGQSVNEWLDSVKRMTVSQEQLDSENREATTTAEKLRASFNELTDAVGPSVLGALKENMPALKDAMSSFAVHIPDIIEDLSKLGEAALWIVDHIPGFHPKGTIAEQIAGAQLANPDKIADYSQNKLFPQIKANPYYFGDDTGLTDQVRTDLIWAAQDKGTMAELTDVMGHKPKNAKEIQDTIMTLVRFQASKDHADIRDTSVLQEEVLKVLKDILVVNTEMKNQSNAAAPVQTAPSVPVRSTTPIINTPHFLYQRPGRH